MLKERITGTFSVFAGQSGLLFFLASYALTNLGAFTAIIAMSGKLDSDLIDDYAGMGKRAPFLALALTLFLPITVAILGNLDWGPVVGGYLAALLLAAAYAAIGLYISARNENQIVSLILTTLVGGIFYLLGV